ncbi:MAG: hypothetical protein Q7T55_17940, partial [Solirubrobacteraceae bacterium]|nr:hypothetical protein [Solirubrobacteraceae bacterium]
MRRGSRLVGLGAVLTALAATGTPVAASAEAGPAAVVDLAAAPGGPQLVIRVGEGGSVSIGGSGGVVTVSERAGRSIDIADDAAGRCTAPTQADEAVSCRRSEPPAPGTARTSSSRAGASSQPIRIELTPGAGWTDATGSPGPVEVVGSSGTDLVMGSPYDDVIRLHEGDDYAQGNDGNDRLELGDGGDDGFGGKGEDWIDGGDGPDWIEGDGQRDTLIGGGGDDLLLADNYEGNSDRTISPNAARNGYDLEVQDAPASCGDGNDTVGQRSPWFTPILQDCEHAMLQPAGAPLSIAGTLAVGSELTAARPPVGIPASFDDYRWLACGYIGYDTSVGDCVIRGFCPTLRLEPGDVGRRIMLTNRVVYTINGGQFKLQPGDEYA